MGECPNCGAPLHNPSKEQIGNLSMSLRWEVDCPECGTRVVVENPRFIEANFGKREEENMTEKFDLEALEKALAPKKEKEKKPAAKKEEQKPEAKKRNLKQSG